jgi:thiamine biosynthesis lipoprotein
MTMAAAVMFVVAGCAGTERGSGSGRRTAPAELRRFEFVRQKLGGPFGLVLFAPDEAAANRAAEAAFARVDELNVALSDYDPKSEISRLSQQTLQGPMKEPVAVSEDLFVVLSRGVELARLTDGAFDVTVGPYMRLWRRAKDLGQLPTNERLEKTRPSVGYHHVKLDPRKRTVQLTAARMRLDVGGLALGYIADEAREAMAKAGVTRVLVDAGGEVSVGEPPPGRDGWRVAVQSLKSPEEMTGCYVKVWNSCVTTSGDTRRFIEIEGKRYSHIIDPRVGLGLTRRIGATVISPDGMTADALDTAVCVLGPQKGNELVERTPGAAAMITTIEGDEVRTFESSRWREFVEEMGGAGEAELQISD